LELENKEYSIYLLEWCNNIHRNWERLKPRFSKLFDLKSLEEWENSCLYLREGLEKNLNLDSMEAFQTAINLYNQWEVLYREFDAHPENSCFKKNYLDENNVM
jgi:hypothetical protein